MKPIVAAAVAALTLSSTVVLAGPGGAGHSHGAGGETAYGKPGDPKKPARIVPVSMRETDGKMLFFPDKLEVRRGEQVRFKLQNGGELAHEFVIATVDENRKHAEEMKKNPDMEHDDPNAKRLDPKKSGEIIWQFTKAGEFEFACLIPGHLEAGMKGTIVVK
ncbi:cupredoxin domain-containing protein [Enterovirga aerilata]|uniref:Cupredoxin family protein n=1 Tax=Enterovirga aerilata TaxID=2730920 RepID=A0A849I7Y8_9HYPH|nr:cupredoxin family protein [Enterovirga sp. DB1703]NNM73894.1 cupredoxin family protein [Enterovirga sp. DB1703]